MLNTFRASWTPDSEEHPAVYPEGQKIELAGRILEFVGAQPEGTPLNPEALDHLGSPEAIRAAMYELVEQGNLNQIYENVYIQPVQTRFGACSPAFEKVIPHLADLWKETIVHSGGASANVLGMTTQVPVRPVYLTSGEDRTLRFGNLIVELRNAPDWQLMAPGQLAGDAIRALAWLGPQEIEEGLEFIRHRLSIKDLKELTDYCPTMPGWITESVNTMAGNV